jgi:hypothetical protein
MYTKVIFVLAAAVLFGAIYAGSEALARGGGGGRGGHAGMMSGWHGSAWHGMHRMSSHGAHFPFKGQHSHGMHKLGHNEHHSQGMHKLGHNKHHHMMAQGQWHSVSGFGSHGQKLSDMPGVWHKVSGFGGHGQLNNARDFRRDWQAGGGGFVGDLCLSPQGCQGVWQIVPQTRSPPIQSRSLQKSWQINGEL